MATNKLLQTPQIIQVTAGVIRVAHPSILGNTTTYLRSTFTASSTSLTVADNRNIVDTDQIVLGAFGDQQTEAVLVNSAVTLGTALSIANTTKFSKELDCPVIKMAERSVTIYGASSDGGSLSAAIATVTLQVDKPYTEYALVTTDTSYAYYVAKFTDGTTLGSASAYVPAAGVSYSVVESFIQQALDLTNSELDGRTLTRDMCVRWAQDCQQAITQFVYQDPLSQKFVQKDWSFEVIEDKTSIAATQNENTYALSALSSLSKYPNSDKSIIDVRLGTNQPFRKTDIQSFDYKMQGVSRTTVATQPGIGQTTLVLTDGTEFNSGGGSILVGVDTVTYTSRTSNTLSGIPASGTGSITVAHPVGTAVWQNITAGLPNWYVIFNGNLIFDRPINSTNVGLKVKIRYYYAIPRLALVSDSTVIPFTNVFQYYLASKMETRKQNPDKAGVYMADFTRLVTQNALADIIPATDSYSYWKYPDQEGYVNPDLYYNYPQ